MSFSDLANDSVVETTKQNLEERGFKAHIAESAQQAKDLVENLLKEGSKVMQMSSVTLDDSGVSALINESGKYDASKNKLWSDSTSEEEKKMLGYAPDTVVGSVNAMTQNGELVIASNTGSQIGAYAYGANQVIFVISTQKITENLDSALKRVYEHVLPQESVRVQAAYGMEKSNVSKLLILNNEIVPNRTHVILVKEKLGY